MTAAGNPVLVLEGGVSALWIARALGRRGIEVYLAVDKGMESAIFSRYCRGGFVARGVSSNRDVLKDLLITVGRSLSRRVVVYPTNDVNTLMLSELKDELPDNYHFVVGDKESVEILVRKSKFYRALECGKIDFPATYFSDNMEDVQRIGEEISYPVFVRPSVTQLFEKMLAPFMGGVSRKGFVAHSLEELVECYSLATRYGIEVMFQEIIPGPPTNSYQLEGYYDMNHRPTVLFARQRLRIWPTDFGNTTLCVSIPLAKLDEQKKKINEFMNTIGYHGLMSAEFKKDPRDGILKIFEINARPWTSLMLSIECGADIVFSSYLDAIGEKTRYTEDYRTGVKSMFLLQDLAAAGKLFLEGNLGFREWISSLLGERVFDWFARDDLSPFIMDSAVQAVGLPKALRGLLTRFR